MIVQRLARDSLNDPMEVERGETTDSGQPGQRKFSVQMLANIVEYAVNALVIVTVAPHRPSPDYTHAGLERRLDAVIRPSREWLDILLSAPGQYSVRALFVRTREAFGRLDVLFNNAGTSAPAIPLEDLLDSTDFGS
jgi:NAD(P)-dependent dehydrogenase (short-subunit alcohol dehydrogenase family)